MWTKLVVHTNIQMGNKRETIWGRISWKLFMLKVKCWSLEISIKNSWRKFFHCRKGYHKLSPNHLRVETSRYDKNTKKRIEKCLINAHWLECSVCGILFFDDAKEKEKYQKYQKRKGDMIKMAFEKFKESKNGSRK